MSLSHQVSDREELSPLLVRLDQPYTPSGICIIHQVELALLVVARMGANVN
jgi:hypothetical protein